MASIDSYINDYILESGFTFEPVIRAASTDTEDGAALPVTRRLHATPTYRGTLTVSFPSRALADSFLSFWQANRHLTFTWTNPDDGQVYTCKFVNDAPGYTRQGPEQFVYQFDIVGVR